MEKKPKLALSVLAILVLGFFGLATLLYVTPASYGTRNNSHFEIYISPSPGHTFSDVTLYLPFPNLDGKPASTILGDMSKSEDGKHISPTMQIISTKHGKMLKIHISKIDSTDVKLIGTNQYVTKLPVNTVDKRYSFSPLTKDDHSFVFASFKGDGDLSLYIEAQAGFDTNYLPEQERPYIGKRWSVAGSKPPEFYSPNYEKNIVLRIKQGWNEVPVWISGDYSGPHD